MIDARLSGNILQNTTQIFSAPEEISPGEVFTASELTTYLQRVGYRPEADDAALGQYTVNGSVVDIRPSKLSYFAGGNALTIQFGGKTIRAIRPLGGGTEMASSNIQVSISSASLARRGMTCAMAHTCKVPARLQCKWRVPIS